MLNLDKNPNEFNSFDYLDNETIKSFVLQNKKLYYDYKIPYMHSNDLSKDPEVIARIKELASIEFSKIILNNMVESFHIIKNTIKK
jgi:hypothetical protein